MNIENDKHKVIIRLPQQQIVINQNGVLCHQLESKNDIQHLKKNPQQSNQIHKINNQAQYETKISNQKQQQLLFASQGIDHLQQSHTNQYQKMVDSYLIQRNNYVQQQQQQQQQQQLTKSSLALTKNHKDITSKHQIQKWNPTQNSGQEKSQKGDKVYQPIQIVQNDEQELQKSSQNPIFSRSHKALSQKLQIQNNQISINLQNQKDHSNNNQDLKCHASKQQIQSQHNSNYLLGPTSKQQIQIEQQNASQSQKINKSEILQLARGIVKKAQIVQPICSKESLSFQDSINNTPLINSNNNDISSNKSQNLNNNGNNNSNESDNENTQQQYREQKYTKENIKIQQQNKQNQKLQEESKNQMLQKIKQNYFLKKGNQIQNQQHSECIQNESNNVLQNNLSCFNKNFQNKEDQNLMVIEDIEESNYIPIQQNHNQNNKNSIQKDLNLLKDSKNNDINVNRDINNSKFLRKRENNSNKFIQPNQFQMEEMDSYNQGNLQCQNLIQNNSHFSQRDYEYEEEEQEQQEEDFDNNGNVMQQEEEDEVDENYEDDDDESYNDKYYNTQVESEQNDQSQTVNQYEEEADLDEEDQQENYLQEQNTESEFDEEEQEDEEDIEQEEQQIQEDDSYEEDDEDNDGYYYQQYEGDIDSDMYEINIPDIPPLPDDLEFALNLQEEQIYEEYEPNDESFTGNTGLTKAEIMSLPTVVYTTQIIRTKVMKQFSSQQDCSICLSNYQDKEILRVLPCEHRFHRQCIDKWLTQNSKCVICKNDLLVNNQD